MSEAKFKFCGEATVIPVDEDDFENASSICVVQCMKCGWNMFGDAWWQSPTVNYRKGEQIPNFCAHCGAEFTDEVKE